jgi:hypothetical protein
LAKTGQQRKIAAPKSRLLNIYGCLLHILSRTAGQHPTIDGDAAAVSAALFMRLAFWSDYLNSDARIELLPDLHCRLIEV